VPETLPEHIPSPRTPVGWDGTRYQAFRIHTDGTVQVRGEDQLFSYKDKLQWSEGYGAPADGSYDRNSPAVPDGEVWVVTAAMGYNHSGPGLYTRLSVIDPPTERFVAIVSGPAQYVPILLQGWVVLTYQDYMRFRYAGVLAGHLLNSALFGWKFTKET